MPDGFDGAFFADGPRHEYERCVRAVMHGHLQRRHAAEAGERVVGQDHVRLKLFQCLRQLIARVHPMRDDLEAAFAHLSYEQYRSLGDVLHQQHLDRITHILFLRRPGVSGGHLVHGHPEQAGVRDDFDEFLEIHRLYQKAVDAQSIGLHHVALFRG